jgi:hypothetical protein
LVCFNATKASAYLAAATALPGDVLSMHAMTLADMHMRYVRCMHGLPHATIAICITWKTPSYLSDFFLPHLTVVAPLKAMGLI